MRKPNRKPNPTPVEKPKVLAPEDLTRVTTLQLKRDNAVLRFQLFQAQAEKQIADLQTALNATLEELGKKYQFDAKADAINPQDGSIVRR